ASGLSAARKAGSSLFTTSRPERPTMSPRNKMRTPYSLERRNALPNENDATDDRDYRRCRRAGDTQRARHGVVLQPEGMDEPRDNKQRAEGMNPNLGEAVDFYHCQHDDNERYKLREVRVAAHRNEQYLIATVSERDLSPSALSPDHRAEGDINEREN